MRNKNALEALLLPQVQATNLTSPLIEAYGDFHQLDAYPWLIDQEDYEDGSSHKTLQERRDTFDGPRGLMHRHWSVTGFQETGLPRRSDAELYLTLLLKTLADGSGSDMIRFSYRELALYFDLTPGFTSDQRIDLALNRLVGVRVRFEGQTAPSTKKGTRLLACFGILASATKIVDGDETFGVIIWNQYVLASVRLLVKLHHVGFLNEQSARDQAETSSQRAVLRSLLAPNIKATPAPE